MARPLKASVTLTAGTGRYQSAMREAGNATARVRESLSGLRGSFSRVSGAAGPMGGAVRRAADQGVRAFGQLRRAAGSVVSGIGRIRSESAAAGDGLGRLASRLAVVGTAGVGLGRMATLDTEVRRLAVESGRTLDEAYAYRDVAFGVASGQGHDPAELIRAARAAQGAGGVRLSREDMEFAGHYMARTGATGDETGGLFAAVSRLKGDATDNLAQLSGIMDEGLFSLGAITRIAPRLVSSVQGWGDITQAGALINIAGLSRANADDAAGRSNRWCRNWPSTPTKSRPHGACGCSMRTARSAATCITPCWRSASGPRASAICRRSSEPRSPGY